jgi:hypothetical protein
MHLMTNVKRVLLLFFVALQPSCFTALETNVAQNRPLPRPQKSTRIKEPPTASVSQTNAKPRQSEPGNTNDNLQVVENVSPNDPTLSGRLTVVAVTPKRLTKQSESRFARARVLYAELLASVQKGLWRELKRVKCASEYDSNLMTDGVAIVLDSRGVIRAQTVLGGTDDHYHEQRSVYDDAGRLRLLFLTYADVQGGQAEHLVYFNENGDLSACDDLIIKVGMPGWSLCSDDSPPVKVEPSVAAVLAPKPKHVPRNEMLESLKNNDPKRAFEACAAPLE